MKCTCKKKQLCELCCPEYFEGDNYECGLFHGLKRAAHLVGQHMRDLRQNGYDNFDEPDHFDKELKTLESVHRVLWRLKNEQKEKLPQGYEESYR